MGLFLDLIDAGERSTNDALEMLCKATHDHDDGIWAPLDSPLIARMVELFTQRGMDRLDAFRVELLAWQSGARHRPGDVMARPIGTMERWNQAEVSLVQLYLEHLPPAAWTLDDHMLAIDFLAQRYLPADDMRTEAEWLTSRASVMGRVQANMGDITATQADVLLGVLPSTVAGVVDTFGATLAQRVTMEYATTRCAENVRSLSSDARHRMRNVVAEHVQARQLGTPEIGGSSLETKLLDQFGALNRDWRRIAVTEAGEAQTHGYVASLPGGTQVKRVERYRNACPFCRSIDGRVVTVVDPAKPDKNWETEIWAGKNNIGRSASPRKRVGAVFKEREPEEMWTIPAGLVHPHCRGRWVSVGRAAGDEEFAGWLRTTLADVPVDKEIE